MTSSWKTETCHAANFVVWWYHRLSLWCRQWRHGWHHGDSRFPMTDLSSWLCNQSGYDDLNWKHKCFVKLFRNDKFVTTQSANKLHLKLSSGTMLPSWFGERAVSLAPRCPILEYLIDSRILYNKLSYYQSDASVGPDFIRKPNIVISVLNGARPSAITQPLTSI